MVSGLYEAVLKAFKEMVEPYEGEFTEGTDFNGDDCAEFTSPNPLSKWSNECKEDGKKCEYVHKTRIIPCTLSICERDTYVSVSAEEATCEYVGGRSSPCETLEEAMEFINYALKEYNYRKKKGYEQLSLF